MKYLNMISFIKCQRGPILAFSTFVFVFLFRSLLLELQPDMIFVETFNPTGVLGVNWNKGKFATKQCECFKVQQINQSLHRMFIVDTICVYQTTDYTCCVTNMHRFHALNVM